MQSRINSQGVLNLLNQLDESTYNHSVRVMLMCQDIVLYHHGEYPPVLTTVEELQNDEEILYKANLLRSVDIYEALTSDRPYHCAVKPKMALEIMMNDRKTRAKKLCAI